MEQEIEEGPFTIWKMLNTPILALFKNLDVAAEPLERLLTSLLKSTGDFPEVLVPRQDANTSHVMYYKSFTKWLLGRIFYAWSSQHLSRIHTLSTAVQIKILTILIVHRADYCTEIQTEYVNLFQDLMNYFEAKQNDVKNSKLTLKYFNPECKLIVTEDIMLEPLFVEINDLETCKIVMKHVLEVLATVIPQQTCYYQNMNDYVEELLTQVLRLFVEYDLSFKNISLNFFAHMLQEMIHYGTDFVISYSKITENLLTYIEAFEIIVEQHCFTSNIDVLEKKELISANELVADILNTIGVNILNSKNTDVLINICRISLENKNSELVPEKLKCICLRLSCDLNLPMNCYDISNIKANDLACLSKYYTKQILAVTNLTSEEEFKFRIADNYFYKQLCVGCNCLEAITSNIYEEHIIEENLKKFDTILMIFQNILFKKIDDSKSYINIMLPPEMLSKYMTQIKNIIGIYNNMFLSSQKVQKILYSILLKIANLYRGMSTTDTKLWIQICCLNSGEEAFTKFCVEVQGILLRTLMLFKLFQGSKVEIYVNKLSANLFNRLSSPKNKKAALLLIDLAPLLVVTKQQPISITLATHFSSYLEHNDSQIEELIVKMLPLLSCISLNKCKVQYTLASDQNKTQIQYECEQCTKENDKESHRILLFQTKPNADTTESLRNLFEKYLSNKLFKNSSEDVYAEYVKQMSRHSVYNESAVLHLFSKFERNLVFVIQELLSNILESSTITEIHKEKAFNAACGYLSATTKNALTINAKNYDFQMQTLDVIKKFGFIKNRKVLLPATKLLVFYLTDSKSSVSPVAASFLSDICEEHGFNPNLVYHRYKKDFCNLIAVCCLRGGDNFAAIVAKTLQAFGFHGYRSFLLSEAYHFLPYVLAYTIHTKTSTTIIEEMSSLLEVSPAELLSECFPQIYTHLYLNATEEHFKTISKLIEKITNKTTEFLIKKHYRVLLAEFLLQFCCFRDKVLKVCRFLTALDPETETKNATTMSLAQIADFLQPRFLGILSYFDCKLVNSKVALSVKRKLLQSFPEIIKIMGPKHMTPLRFKILATLRSSLTLIAEFPKIIIDAWIAFVYNIDTISLGPLLASLTVPLIQQYKYAPDDIDKLFNYLVISNENLLSSNIPDLLFIEDTGISKAVKDIVRKHVVRCLPSNFMDKVKWYMNHFSQDLAEVKAYALKCLNLVLRDNQIELYKAIVASRTIDPVIIELHTSLLQACEDTELEVQLWAAKCLGQLGGLKTSQLSRQCLSKNEPFVFSIDEDNFAAIALVEMTRAFQYEKNSRKTDFCALMIQEILKGYNITPDGPKKELWDSFPEHMHQIMTPLLTSRYMVACPTPPKQISPVFGSVYGSTFIEWAYNWSGQLIPQSMTWLVSVHASMRQDARALTLFLPYIVLQALRDETVHEKILKEIETIIRDDTGSDEKTLTTNRDNSSSAQMDNDKKQGSERERCKRLVFELLDFLNRWMLEWCHNKTNPTSDPLYKKVKHFTSRLCLVELGVGCAKSGYYARALQYLERAAQNDLQSHLSLLAELYALLDEPDAVSGLLTIKRCEPSLKEMIMAQLVTGRLADAAAAYERMAQDGLLDNCSRRNLVECYLGLDQPYTAYSLLSDLDGEFPEDMAAEAMWRLGKFDQLEEMLQHPIDPSKDNWGLLMGRTLTAFRAKERAKFEATMEASFGCLLSNAEGHILPLHILSEVTHAKEMAEKLAILPDGAAESKDVISKLLNDWRLRLCLVQSDLRSVEPLLRCRIILLQQTKELLLPSHPKTAKELHTHLGNMWLKSAKIAREAGKLHQAYMYVLNAEKYQPAALFIEKAKTYLECGQKELALVTLKRNLEERFNVVDMLPTHHPNRKLCAKGRLLIASYNDENAIVDVEANIALYKDAVLPYSFWEKSLACLARYFEKACGSNTSKSRDYRLYAIKYFGAALQHGHTQLYTTLPRMLSLWLDYEEIDNESMWRQMNDMIEMLSRRLPLYLLLTAFSQIISRICHPVIEVYIQIKNIIVKSILEYPQHTLWMLISVMKSSYKQRILRCNDIFKEARLKKMPAMKFIQDFTQLAEKLIELCNKPLTAVESGKAQVSQIVRALPRLLASKDFSEIMVPIDQYRKIMLPDKRAGGEGGTVQVVSKPLVYIRGIQEEVTILPSLQKPRKCTLLGSDGKKYVIMLKPKDDLRKDFRLMEFNDVVNGFLKQNCGGGFYIRTYSVVPLNEECGLIQWLPNLEGLRPILLHIYKQKGIATSNRELKEMICNIKDPLTKKRSVFTDQLLPRYPPVFHEWFLRTFPDPTSWYQARSAYIRTTAVMSIVGYIVGLGDRHGENILFDSTSGDIVHVDFNCLFNKGESFEWPERVPFRLTHNMETAMGPLGREGLYRKTCEKTMRTLRSQSSALTSVLRPLLYDPLVSWQQAKNDHQTERVNFTASEHLQQINNRLQGMIRTKNKQCTLALSAEGVVDAIIDEATSIDNLCQMYIGWGAFM